MFLSEGEKWARIVIFILVALYSMAIFVLTINYMIRNYFCIHRRRSLDWGNRYSFDEYSCSRHGVFFTFSDDDPPQFEAALRYPAPNIKVVPEIEQPPPSYEDYIKSLSNTTSSSTQALNQDMESPKYLEIDEVKLHM